MALFSIQIKMNLLFHNGGKISIKKEDINFEEESKTINCGDRFYTQNLSCKEVFHPEYSTRHPNDNPLITAKSISIIES